jgi:DNA-binding beta-propeller fold protein YncE
MGMFGGKIMIGSDSSGPIYSSLLVHRGRMLCTTRGYRHTKQLVCIGTDGTSGGEDTMKAKLPRKRGLLWGSQEIAVSPDGVWIYFTGLGARNDDGWNAIQRGDWSASKHVGQRRRHAVYRMAWVEKGPVGQPFIGEENLPQYSRGKDNRHFDFPTGIACDSRGRIYVSDHNNNRIQVFSTEPKHLKTIKCPQPWQLAVHPKTGEIYVHCYPNRAGRRSKARFQARIVKFAGFDNPRKVKEWAIPSRSKQGSPPRPLFCLDAWTKPARVWITNYGAVQVYEETGDGFKLLLDFPKKVAADGHTPGSMGRSYRNRLAAVPDSYLYLSRGKTAHNTTRVDPEEGKRFQRVHQHWTGTFEFDELIAAPDGFLYVRGVPWVARMREPTFPFEGGVSFTPEDEVPFDYGEKRAGGFSHSYRAWASARGKDTGRARKGTVFRGVVPIPSVPGGNYENMGVNVSPKGHVIAFAKVYGRVLEYKDRKQLGLNEVAMKQYLAFIKSNAGFAPKTLPGVLSGGELVFTYDIRGEPMGEALVATPTGSCGIAMDKEGNLYVGAGIAPHKPAPGTFGGRSGIVAKFPPTGGKIYGQWGPLGLKGSAVPTRTPEFFCPPGSRLWSRNMYWSFPGVGQITQGQSPGCTCPQSRFHVDLYSRLFAPMAWRFCVAVLDTNGNPITFVARYGNADSGRGPKSPLKVKGGITTAHCSFLAIVSDRWLYMMDSGNNRIVRVKLDYAAEETARLAGS